MPCTTILAGRKATYDGSTLIARNDDSGAGGFTPKKFTVVLPDEQPRVYESVLSHVRIPLPDDPMRYICVPNASKKEGLWAACGVNEANVGMTATETIASNERVLGADPLVVYQKAEGEEPERIGGIGEEDIVTLVLPYIRSAREGVQRLGKLLEEYGTWEMNGVAFSDEQEVWWMETIGGHHWIAKRVPDDCYVVMANQQGIDAFDLADALGEGREHLCSRDLKEFMEDAFLDVSNSGRFTARDAFGTRNDADHIYNTPRVWYMLRCFNPGSFRWDGPDAEYGPLSDDLPWCMVPERKITPEDIKYVLSSHFQGTPYDPYAAYGSAEWRGAFRSIGINRTDFMGMVQIRPYMPASCRSLLWLAFASNVFNAMVPLYANITEVPEYLAVTGDEVSTGSFYWASRLIAALADASYGTAIAHIERYQEGVAAKARARLVQCDRRIVSGSTEDVQQLLVDANRSIEKILREETEKILGKVLDTASNHMKNAYARSDH